MTTSKFAIFKGEMLDALSTIPGGSPRYRKYRYDTVLRLADSIRATGMMPTRFKNLKPEAIIKMVYYWKKKGIQPETIKNKLAVLRMIVKRSEIDIEIPSNSDLKVKVKTYKVRQPSFKKLKPDEIDCPMLLDIFWIEYLFGFKKIEALKSDHLFCTKVYTGQTFIDVHRRISYNRLDRYILIATTEQIEFLEGYQKRHTRVELPSKKTFRAMSLLHDSVLESYGIKNPDYFRQQYIVNRYTALLQNGIEMQDAIKTVSRETGYKTSRQIVEILKMLKKL
jgi:Phage integrase, N-terminal